MTPITFELLHERLSARPPARIKDPWAVQAAVALVLVPAGDHFEALFIRRAEVEGDPWSGHMALPGGRRQPDDGDLADTAIRETAEETGIVLSRDQMLGELDEYKPRAAHLPRITVRPFVFAVDRRPDIILSDEVAESFWIPVADLQMSRREVEIEVQGAILKVPAFVLGANVVWGLTERILTPFIDLLTRPKQ